MSAYANENLARRWDISQPGPTAYGLAYATQDWEADMGLWGKIKKVAKRLAPIVGVAASFVPGGGVVGAIAKVGRGVKAAKVAATAAKVARTAKAANKLRKVAGRRSIPGAGSVAMGAGMTAGAIAVEEGVKLARKLSSKKGKGGGKRRSSASLNVYVGGGKKKKKAKRRKSTKKPSAKQLAARRKFAARFGGRRRRR